MTLQPSAFYNNDKMKMSYYWRQILMGKILTLEDALKRIEELENENAELKKELEYYKNRK